MLCCVRFVHEVKKLGVGILTQAQPEFALIHELGRYVMPVQRGLEKQEIRWPVLLHHLPVVVNLWLVPPHHNETSKGFVLYPVSS